MKSYRSPYYLVGSVSKGADERWDLADRRLRPALLTGSAFFLLGAILFAGEFAAAMGGNPAATMNTAPSFEQSSALPMVPQVRARTVARSCQARMVGRSAHGAKADR